MGTPDDLPSRPTLRRRAAYAVIGFISGGLFSLFTVLPLCVLYVRRIGRWDHSGILLWGPLGFATLIGIWGFVSTEGMVDRLARWW